MRSLRRVFYGMLALCALVSAGCHVVDLELKSKAIDVWGQTPVSSTLTN